MDDPIFLKLDMEDTANAVDVFVRALPLLTATCQCGHHMDLHQRLGRRNVWSCKGNDWRCLCIEFVAKGSTP